MGINRKWQFICILSVLFLTVYNIAPTLFYYLQPLREPITQLQAEKISREIADRVGDVEKGVEGWIASFCETLQVKPVSIAEDPMDSQRIAVRFAKEQEALRFQKFLSRAGSLVSFSPARLKVFYQDEDPNTVFVQKTFFNVFRQDTSLFGYAAKQDAPYKEWILERASRIVQILNPEGPSFDSIMAQFRQEGLFSFPEKHSAFSQVRIDFTEEKIHLRVDKAALEDAVVAEVSLLSRLCHEKAVRGKEGFDIAFHGLAGTSGVLMLDMERLANIEIEHAISALKHSWNPLHPDLKEMKIVTSSQYQALSEQERELCLIAMNPLASLDSALPFDSIYFIAKGLERIEKSYASFASSPLAETFRSDVRMLMMTLHQHGFFRAEEIANAGIAGDLLFRKEGYASSILAASREDFRIFGNGKRAVLDLGDREQRIVAQNRIETAIHQDLVKWSEEYLAAQVGLNPESILETPKPNRSVFWSNFLLSCRKIFRGDERKILKWGLDLSGGKTVEIELFDGNGNLVESELQIKQGISELYQRVNKMGLSEVVIRQVGNRIVLDFPGSQSLSAQELIQASTMAFHIVNEKFSPHSSAFGNAVNAFLQKVWDEAVISGKTDAVGVNAIARKHLSEGKKTDTVKALLEGGLRLSSEEAEEGSLLSQVAMWKGASPSEWKGLSHPLFFVYKDSALEGSHLENIHSSYDASKGNHLSFSVASSAEGTDGVRFNPQTRLYSWTSRYAKEAILGTPEEMYSQGRGWRMAVILNGVAISAPALESAISDQAMISGSFSQSDVQRLAADLTAGSLSFTPHILSEKNVSPELGKTDRALGITATIAAFFLVVVCMVTYYRFAGVVASVAVVLNLLIMWAVLQNLGATLTLAGIAGIILTVGMSIDANVLVFERIKEEFALSGHIGSAIHAGYQRAFSAILDSNVTTIIAALILLGFDAGPIKSFAMNLIIGIASSMFTALFITRFYFTGWAKNPKNTALRMANWIRETSFDFLKKAKVAYALSLAFIVTGGYLVFFQSSTILGLDFTGGYSLSLHLDPDAEQGYAEKVQKALISHGAAGRDFQVREMNPPHHIRILFAENMEHKGKPFFGLPMDEAKSNAVYAYQNNPRITWVVDSLLSSGVSISPEALAELHADWTSVSGQMSSSMRTNALIGIFISFIAIFVYLAFRFEYPFAAAALLCLVHDVLITLACLGLLHFLGVPVQLDLITIAALMTAVGYSLNDTIIIFDRIREAMLLNPKRALMSTVNGALNFTLGRTTITSLSTLLVLVTLLILGGSSIFGFALVMTLGVVLGTLSSWFIAAPLMCYFHHREELKMRIQ